MPYGINSTEHMWANDLERKEGKILGTINNEPRHVNAIRRGQRIEISEGQISDWMYMRAGKIVGNHTMRPLLKRMPSQEAVRYRAMLAEP